MKRAAPPVGVQPFAWSAAGSAAHETLLGKEITEYAP